MKKTLRLALSVLDLRPVVNAIFILAAIAATVIGTPPSATASPFTDNARMVCDWLDRDASPASVQAMLLDMAEHGMLVDDITSTASYAVTAVCPEHFADIVHARDVIVGPQKKNRAA